jgi:ABC-type transport system involved in cytochrome bd biosynthesis fused ATPase/permease subunit
VRELFDTDLETHPAQTGHVVDGTHPAASPDSAQLVLRDVTVRWPGAATPALHAVSFTVPTGGHVAVVGPSGSGKSTLAMTLAGFLFPEQGALEIAGVDSRNWDEAGRHASVGLLEQHPYLFDTTVAENLLLARPDASPTALGQVLDRVGLGPWAAGLPQGLDTRVGEHGRRLSGGQQQRLGLARLLLADHPILVLDEPDEHLDALSADALMADLLEASGDRTSVVISHRLVPLAGVDLIVVLDGGRVSEAGAHGELVARGGWYARAWMREQEIGAAVAAAQR